MILSLLKKRRSFLHQWIVDLGKVLQKEEFSIMVMSFVMRISSFEELNNTLETSLDQLTVNEYPHGVGLYPHIDTHSAFEGSIFSLSLAGSCIMEFRKYTDEDLISKSTSVDRDVENSDSSSSFLKRAIYLPPRSILLLSREARYA